MDLSDSQGTAPLHAFDWTESTSPSTAVIRALAAVSGDDPTTIEPLFDVLDPDALDRLFAPARTPRLQGTVAFEHHGYRITVRADGRGSVVREADSDAPAERRRTDSDRRRTDSTPITDSSPADSRTDSPPADARIDSPPADARIDSPPADARIEEGPATDEPSPLGSSAGSGDGRSDRTSERERTREPTGKCCLDCGWRVRATDGYTKRERAKRAIDHHATTGHTVHSIR